MIYFPSLRCVADASYVVGGAPYDVDAPGADDGDGFLVGTLQGRLSKLEDQLFAQPWKQVQDPIKVLCGRGAELFLSGI